MDNFETIIVLMVALATSVLGVTAFVGWWLNGTLQAGIDELRQGSADLRTRVEDQSSKLTSIRADLHGARLEVTGVHSQVGRLRAEMDVFVHGPPSLRDPLAGSKHEETHAIE